MVAILYPRRLRNQLDVTQPAGLGLPDAGIPVLYSSNSSFVIETHGGGGGAFSLGASNLGNTLGQTGVTGSRIVLAGVGNLTLSQLTDLNGATISLSGGSAAAGAFSAGVSGGNTAGDTGVTGTRLVFAGGQSVTLSQATDINGGTITISGASTSQSVQTQNRFNLTLDGNTAGALAQISSGTMTLAGGNGITLSQAGNAVTISGNTFSQSVQPETQTFVGGVSASNTLYTSGTVRMTGAGNITVASSTGQLVVISGSQSVQPETQTFLGGLVASNTTFTSGTVSISGFGDITVNTAANLIRISGSQSLQTSNVHNVTLSGNTSGALAQISSGTMTLAGGNNITLSQAGNAITISGANVGGAQTGISSIVASDATYTSGSVQFTGSGIVTVRSSANQRVVIDASQSTQPGIQHLVASNTTFSSGTVSISGFGAATVNTAANIIRISVPVQTAETAISGIANSQTTYTSGTVSLSELGAITIRSTTGNQFQFSVNSQTLQTSNVHNVTLSGNTSGVMAQVSSGTMTLAGGNNITLSQAGNAITISGANVGGAQTGISGIANSQTTYTSGTVSMSELGAITIRSTTGNQYQFSVNAQSVQPETQTFLGGLVASNTTWTSGTVSISGFGDITVNTAANLIRISGPVQTAQTGISGLANSQTTYTSGTVSMSELGAITIRSTTGNQYQFSVNAQTVQTQNMIALSLSGNTAGVMALVSSGTLNLAGGNNITLSQNGNSVTISGGAAGGFSAGVSTGGATAGDTGVTGTRLVFVGTNNITLSQATAAAGGTVTISGPTTVAQTNQAGSAYAVGNTYSSSSGTFDARTLSIRGDGIISVAATNSGWRISASQSVQAETQTFVGGIAASNTTYTSGTITITGVGGGVTVSSNTGQRVDISVAAPVAQTNQAGSVYAVGNTYSSSSGTYDARTVSLRGDGIISIAATNSGFRISASQSVQPETQTFLGGISLSGNTAGVMALISSGTMNLAGGNNITLSQNGQSVTISGGAGGGFSAGVSNVGNTQGDTGVTGTRLVLVGTNNITLSQATDANGGTISISGQSPAGGAFSGGASNLGNTAGATGITGTQLVLVGSGPISLSQTTGANGGTLSINAPATSSLVGTNGISISTNGSTISIMQTTGSGYLTSLAPYDESPVVTGQQGQGSLHLSPLRVPEGLQFDRVGLGAQYSNATNSSGSMTISNWVGLYTRTGSSVSLLASTSISTNFTGSGTVGSYSLFAGPRWQTIGWTTTLTEGDYFMAILSRTTSGGANMIASQLLLSKFTNSAWSGMVGVSSATSNQRNLGQGHYSATTSSLPASIAFSQILGTATEVWRTPIYMFRSGTV